MKLIITADDYGMSQSVNDSIIEGIRKKTITSTNVMMNMDFLYDKDIERLKSLKDIASVGLHWNITAGKPLSNPKDIQSLVNKEGLFYSQEELFVKLKQGSIKKEHVRQELIKQYKKYESIFGKPDYWNSHQNMHLNKHLFLLFLKVAKECEIFKMRNHQRLFIENKEENHKLNFKKKVVESIKHIILMFSMFIAKRKYKMRFPNRILSHVNNNDRMDFELLNNKKIKKRWIYELVIHPAKTIDSKYFGSMTDNRLLEDEVFCEYANETKIKFNNNNIVLVSFDKIK